MVGRVQLLRRPARYMCSPATTDAVSIFVGSVMVKTTAEICPMRQTADVSRQIVNDNRPHENNRVKPK